jgi:hypothetical protein
MFVTYRRFIAAAISLAPLFLFAQVKAKDDYAHTTVNAATRAVKVLSNDNATTGVLKIDKIPLTNHGKATISADATEILFTPEKDYKGIAWVNYTATDGLGHYDCGLLTINISEQPLQNEQTIKLFTRPGENITFTVPLGCDQIVLSEPTATGDANWGTGPNAPYIDGVYHFKPNRENFVSSNFRFTKLENGLSKTYNVFVDVVGTPLPVFLKDDYVYMPLGNPKVINVFSNDSLAKPIRSFDVLPSTNPNYSVTKISNGRVLVTPNANFKGTFNFNYDITYFDDTKESATVHTTVANYEPAGEVFEVTAYQGVPYEFKYNIPLPDAGSAWTFVPRNNGITNAGGVYQVNIVNGKSEIVYTPPVSGESDYFEVEYCVAGASCKVIKVNVNLQPATPQICSTDCVFPGDANRDGIVDMWDLMTVGSYIGQYGAARVNTDLSWTPTSAANWGSSLETGVNIKNADLNGDGLISALDTAVISANFGKVNSIVSEKTPELSQIELQVLTTSNTAGQGDMIEITVLAGSSALPIVDAHGLSFSVGYDADLVQENTMTVDFLPSSWLTRYDAFIAMSKLVNRGRLEAGIARSQDRGVSGHGEVTKIRAVVIDDLAGFHVGDKPVIRFRINDVYMMDKKGRRVQIEGKEIAIPLKIVKKDEPMKESDLLMFPNPSSDFMSFYLNGVNNIESLRVVDMMGKEVTRQNNIKGKQATVYFDNLATGMYIAEVMTEKGKITKKMQVVK